MTKWDHDTMQRSFSQAFGGSGGMIKFTPGAPYREKSIPRPPMVELLDTQIVCPECQFGFKVYGIFGYCPKCRAENARIYDENLRVVRAEVANSGNPRRALRRAYTDLISAMEGFFKSKDTATGRRPNWFQSLANIDEFSRAKIGKGLADILAPEELGALERAFQKRHCLAHANGIIDLKYVEKYPADGAVGAPVPLAMEEFEMAATATHKVIGANFVP
jgi:hypothetical protein